MKISPNLGVQAAKTPLTDEQIRECQEMEESFQPTRARPPDNTLGGPFIIAWLLFLLPFWLYGFLKHHDPYDKQLKS